MKKAFIQVILASFSTVGFAQGGGGPLAGPQAKPLPAAEWTTLRANDNRDGRIVAQGEFKGRPRVHESIDYAISEAYIELSAGDITSSVTYRPDKVSGKDVPASLSAEWQIRDGAYLDLKGDGKITTVSVTQNIKYAKLFEGDEKYYRIEAHDGFSVTGNVNNAHFVGIRVYVGDTDKLVFEKEFPKGDLMQRPHITVADMDNDGQKDIVITSWEGVYVFDNKGRRIAHLSQEVKGWHHLRKRGFACLQDIDNNGYKDVVIISSLPWHVDVIKNYGGVLTFGWTRIFDGLVESAKKISKPILNSVRDFDGDGSYEILVNVFNFNDDDNWSAIIFDATNGEVKAQIRDVYVLSADDVNNDGRYIFFCTATQGQAVPSAAALKVVAFEKGGVHELLHIEEGEWINPRTANVSPIVTTHWDGVSNLAEDAVLCADFENKGRKSFFARTTNDDGSTLISGYYRSGSGTERAPLTIRLPPGMYGEIVRTRKGVGGGEMLLAKVKAFGMPEGTIRIEGAAASDRGRYVGASSKTHIPVVADIDADGMAEILIPNDVGEVLCFSRNTKGKMELAWRVPGRGMTWQYAPVLDYGISVADLDHDGYKEVIVSGADEVGSVVSVYDHRGGLVWKTGFPEINGGEITSWDGNIAFYGTAQSSQRAGRDVIVTVQRGIAHGGKTYCLSGKDGSILWLLDRLEAERGQGQDPIESGAGGFIFSVSDIDNDGSDEVMCGYGNVVFFADSNDGSVKFKKFMRKVFTDKYDYPSKGYTSFWMQQILPVQFTQEGVTALACFNTAVAAGTMNIKGDLTWCPRELDYGDRYWQCMANLDGDGKLWVVELSIHNPGRMPVLFAYDPVTGKEHKNFRMEMPGFLPALASKIMPAACDVDGDGKDEIVVSNDAGVVCVGSTAGNAEIQWQYPLQGCGPAVVADTDSDGYVEVVVAARNGKILVLDK